MKPPGIQIENRGQIIAATNYWQSDVARAGHYILSPNAGAIRLLLPPSGEKLLVELQSARRLILSHGQNTLDNLSPDAFELLCDDDSPDPFALFSTPASWIGLPARADYGRDFVFAVWVNRQGPELAYSTTIHLREVPTIPWLKP